MGAGVSHLVGGVIAPPDVPAVIGPHGGGAAAHLIYADPEAAAHGFAQGLSDQANAVGHTLHEAVLNHGAEQVVTSAAAESASGHAVGYAAGIAAAKKVEEMLGECVGEIVFAYAIEKLLDPEIRLELKAKGKCSRLQGPLGQYCRGCGASIRHGKYARKLTTSLQSRDLLRFPETLPYMIDCCEETDDFDLCLPCRTKGTTCACPPDQSMLTLQKSVSGDVLASEKGDVTRRLATISEMRCTSKTCQRLITQGRYYCECTPPPPNLRSHLHTSAGCSLYNVQTARIAMTHSARTATAGNRHVSHQIHTDFTSICEQTWTARTPILLRTALAANSANRKQRKAHSIVSNHLLYTTQPLIPADDLAVCKQCGDEGLCDRCYDMDRRCRDANHILSRYVVYKGEKHITRQFTEKDRCQFCKEQLGTSTFYCESRMSL